MTALVQSTSLHDSACKPAERRTGNVTVSAILRAFGGLGTFQADKCNPCHVIPGTQKLDLLALAHCRATKAFGGICEARFWFATGSLPAKQLKLPWASLHGGWLKTRSASRCPQFGDLPYDVVC